MQTVEENLPVVSSEQSEYFMLKDINYLKENKGREMPLTKKYDPYIFWNGIGQDYYRTFIKPEMFNCNVPWLLDRIKVVGCDSILDAGCGFGRVAPFILHEGLVKEVHGVDISPSIIKSSEDYLNPTPTSKGEASIKDLIIDDRIPADIKPTLQILKEKYESENGKIQMIKDFRSQIKLEEGDIRSLKYDSNSFDVVFTSEVIQHLKPEEAEAAVAECVRVAKKAVIFVERWGFPSEHSEPHLWSYNYGAMIQSLNLDLAQVCSVGPAMQGVVALKR